jgi:flagellar biogenesis protein FliO
MLATSMGSLLDATSHAPTAGSEVLTLLQALCALAIVSGLAYVSLRWLAQRGLGRAQGRLLQVEERVTLDAQSSLLVVRVEGRRLLLAAHRDEAPRLLLELSDTPSAAGAANLNQERAQP